MRQADVDMKIVSARVPAEHVDELERRAAAVDRPVSAEIRQAILDYLNSPDVVTKVVPS